MAEVKSIKTEEGANQKTGQPPRARGSEVFVGGLSHTVTEDMIREIFSSCGEVLEIRMMKDQNGALKGYCFVRFATKEAAMKAQQEKSNLTLQGKKIGVALSSDKDTLFLGNLRKDWVSEDVESMVRQAFQDVVSVVLGMPPNTGESVPDKKKHNRGFAFVHFASHAAAARAHRVGSKQDFMLGGKWRVLVDWAESNPELDPDEMAKVKVAFVGNLPNNSNEDFLRKLFEPFGKLERVAISRKSNMPVGFVHFNERSELDKAMKELDGKTIEGPDKGPMFKIQVTVAKPADKAKKRNREEFQKVVANKSDGQAKTSADVTSYKALDYLNLNAKVPRVDTKPMEVPTVADPYEVAVLSLPSSVTDRLLRIFRQGLATRYDIDIQCLTSLRELPAVTAVAILEQFATNNFADGRNKGAYLAGLIARYKVDSLASRRIPMLHQGQSSDLPSRDAGLLGMTGTNNSSLLLDPLAASRPLPGSALLRHDPYATATSLGSFSQVPQLLTGDSLLERMPTRLDDVHSLSSYRAPASNGFNLGSGLPEASVTERRPPIKFDPFTGQPFKFDPFTGEPIQQPGPVSLPSSHFTGKYY